MMEREQAMRALDTVKGAEKQVRRHAVNNGVIPLVWGTFIVLVLPLFDLVRPEVAAIILALGASSCGLWTAFYARRLPVQASQPAAREFVTLIIRWGAYYVVILVGGLLLLRDRLAYPATVLVPLVAAPLLIGGWRMYRKGR